VTRPTLGVFELLEPIGQGAAGSVWRAVHRASGVDVAIKVIASSHADPTQVASLRAEVQAVAALDHPGVVLVLDHETVTSDEADRSGGHLVAGTPWLAMEFADRGSLDSLAKPLTWPALRRALRAVLAALAHAHAHSVVHRDLKPHNILRFAAGRGRPARLKLADFGLAQALAGSVRGGVYEAPAGTPLYMAPEQIEGSWRDYGPWTDLYALGCTAWQLATGAPPFPGDVRAVVFGHLQKPVPRFEPVEPMPPGLEEWLRRLLEKATADRFQLAADAAWGLEHLAGEPPARPVPKSWRGVATLRRRTHLVGAGLGLHGLRPIPLVGRANERDVLWGELRRTAREGQPRVVFLRGAAGTGKSRLSSFVATRAHELGAAEALFASHRETPTADEGLTGLVRRHLRLGGLHAEASLQRVRSVLDASGPEETWSTNGLVTLVAPDARPDQAVPARAEERFEVVRSLLADVTRRLPAVVVLDDVQWGGEVIRFVRWMLEPMVDRALPVLFLLTARDEALAERPSEAELVERLEGHPSVVRVQVLPLPPEDRDELIAGLLGFSGELAGALAERTAGNPLFAVQLVTSWVERGVLVPGRGGFGVVGSHATPDVPDDLHSVWSSRTERLLAAHARQTGQDVVAVRAALELAATLGQDVDGPEWAAVCEHAGCRGDPALAERLIASRLALRRPSGWSFVHGMLRESLERAAIDSGRWHHHQRSCIEVLTQRLPAGELLTDERIGRHLCAAERWREALTPLLRASEIQRRRGNVRRSMAMLVLREEALRALGLPEDHVEWAVNHPPMARKLMRLGRLDESIEVARRGEAAARAAGRLDLVAESLQARVLAVRLQGDLTTATELTLQGLEIARSIGFSSGIAKLCQGLATVDRLAGRLAPSRRLFLEAERRWREADEVVGAASCVFNLGVLAVLHEDYDEGRSRYEAAIVEFERLGDRTGLADCLNGLGEVARLTGDLEQAEAFYRQAGRLYRAVGSSQIFLPKLNMILVLVEQGDAEGAAAVAREVRPLVVARRAAGLVAFVDAALVRCSAELKDRAVFRAAADDLQGYLDSGVPFVSDLVRDVKHLVEGAVLHAEEQGLPRLARRARTILAGFEALG